MKQIGNPDPRSAQIRVVMDTAELHRLLDPILKEVNALRERIAKLEKVLADDGR